MQCEFQPAEDGWCRCVRCQNKVRANDCAKGKATCRAGGKVEPRIVAACIHRGDPSRPVKIECCGGKNKMVDSSRCKSPAVKQRLCILSGNIADEHERGLIAVCSPTCPGREVEASSG